MKWDWSMKIERRGGEGKLWWKKTHENDSAYDVRHQPQAQPLPFSTGNLHEHAESNDQSTFKKH